MSLSFRYMVLCLQSQSTQLQLERPSLSWELAVVECTQHPVSSLLWQLHFPCEGAHCRETRKQLCSSRLHCQRKYGFLGISSMSALPLILPINSVPFYAVLFYSNAEHSFSNIKLDESRLLWSFEAGLHSAAADLPAPHSCWPISPPLWAVKPHCCFPGGCRLLRCPFPSHRRHWAVPSSEGFLESHLVLSHSSPKLCFKAAVGALTTTSLCH